MNKESISFMTSLHYNFNNHTTCMYVYIYCMYVYNLLLVYYLC